jgi:Protein of unknown function (DUF3089)
LSHPPVESRPHPGRRYRRLLRVAPLALVLATLRLSAPLPATAAEPLAAPDYAKPSAWAAYPGRPSGADEVPQGVRRASDARVPVFFIHPTTDIAPAIGNAAFDAGGVLGARMDRAVLRFQASVFNGCCRIFAPRYRQASLGAITTNSAAAYAADDLAYGDVARAFARFLALNPAGPFILASHSQGSIHALRLLQEKVIGTPLQGRLVVAYLVGVALPTAVASLGLPVCQRPDAIGCIVSWNTVRQGHDDRRRHETSVIWWRGRYEPIAGRPLVCVNPLNWRQDASAPSADNLGAVYSAGRDAPIPAPIPHVTGASCDDGLLGVDIPFGKRRHFRDVLTLAGVYHDFDYSLFYMNLRRNASARIAAYGNSRR